MRLVTAPSGDAADLVIDLDPAHWARQGRIGFDVTVDAGMITAASLVAGFMHRGAEKLFEARDYRQGLALANRHDWLAPVGGEIVMARCAEDLLGLPVPDRARAMRAYLVELSRVAAHLAFLGPAAEPLGMPAEVRTTCAAAREQVLGHLEALSGARMHVTYTVIGGVRAEPPAGWTEQVAATCESFQRDLVPLLESALPAMAERTRGLGVVTPHDAAAYGASGVVARASGIALDVRDTDPDYAALRDLVPRASDTSGDTSARVTVLVAELAAALAMVLALTDAVSTATGPVNSTLPKVLRVPVGSSRQWLETPLGAAGALLESRGDRAPYRYALRTPSFAHAPLVAKALEGYRLADAAAIISSFPLVVGDLDK